MSLLTPEQQKAAEEAEAFDGEFPALPAGRYACRLTEFHPHTTGASFWVKWKIAKGQKFGGQTFLDFPSNTDMRKVKSIFLAIEAPLGADDKDILGKPAWVTVNEEFDNRPEYATKKRNKVQFVSKYDGPALPEEDLPGGDDDLPSGGKDDAADEGLV